MDHSETRARDDRAWAPESSSGPGSEPDCAVPRVRPSLTRAQRLLAWVTGSAALMSGLNALIQVLRVVMDYFARHG